MNFANHVHKVTGSTPVGRVWTSYCVPDWFLPWINLCNVNLTVHLSRCSRHGHATHHWHHGSTLNFQRFLKNRREHLSQESKESADKEVQIKPFVTFGTFSETSHAKLLKVTWPSTVVTWNLKRRWVIYLNVFYPEFLWCKAVQIQRRKSYWGVCLSVLQVGCWERTSWILPN